MSLSQLSTRPLLKRMFLALCLLLIGSIHSYAQTESTIILVRHAEKMDDSRDPELSKIGEQRAHMLYEMLVDMNVNQVYSTSYKRTQSTAKPLADSLSLHVQSYDPRDLEGFAAELKQKEGVILVVGHSNTTPMLTSLLSGQKLEKIDESDYDNLFIVSFSGGSPRLFHLHYPSFEQ